MSEIPLQAQIDEIVLIGLGVRDWINRAEARDFVTSPVSIERKKARLETLRAVLETLKAAKLERYREPVAEAIRAAKKREAAN